MPAQSSRRQFLTNCSAACLASLAASKFSLAANEPDPWGGFPVGVQTISLRKYPLPEVFRHLQGMGVRYVEFSASAHLPATASDEKIIQARQLAEQAGLRISAQGVNRFSSDHAANRRVFEFAKKLGIRIITANPQPDADTFASLEKLVAEYDLRIAIHNHGPGSLYDKLTDVTKVLKDRDPRIGACVDCGHFIASGEDPLKCLRALSDRLYGVHLKDQSEFGSKSPGVILGKGHLDLVSLFKTLREIKFPPDRALSLEYEANPDNPLDDLKACLAATKDAIARSM
ncbi:MAG TPA: sugar phosphate isomerase/epimerase family protein [Pirellulaceae bacterium]|jgi:sugar phosphate isomerase/epimerase